MTIEDVNIGQTVMVGEWGHRQLERATVVGLATWMSQYNPDVYRNAKPYGQRQATAAYGKNARRYYDGGRDGLTGYVTVRYERRGWTRTMSALEFSRCAMAAPVEATFKAAA